MFANALSVKSLFIDTSPVIKKSSVKGYSGILVSSSFSASRSMVSRKPDSAALRARTSSCSRSLGISPDLRSLSPTTNFRPTSKRGENRFQYVMYVHEFKYVAM